MAAGLTKRFMSIEDIVQVGRPTPRKENFKLRYYQIFFISYKLLNLYETIGYGRKIDHPDLLRA
jgi:hypothetical protein